MNKNPNHGVYPTMITPYNKDGKIDFGAVDALVEWYWKKGCDGIFAACQSSEIFFLTLDERVALARRVKEKAAALADGSRPGLAWAERTGDLRAGHEELVVDLPAALLGDGPVSLDVRLLGLSRPGVAGRATLDVAR